MQALKIFDTEDGFLAFDLRHVLAALECHVTECYWEVGGVASYDEPVFATGAKAEQLQELAISGKRISGTELRDLADGVHQIIWGEFRAYEDQFASAPLLIVRAVDSSFYEVVSNDPVVQDSLREAFRDVRPS